MAKTLIASKLINKVVAQVDRSSFKKARDSVTKLHEKMKKFKSPLLKARVDLSEAHNKIKNLKNHLRSATSLKIDIEDIKTPSIKPDVNTDSLNKFNQSFNNNPSIKPDVDMSAIKSIRKFTDKKTEMEVKVDVRGGKSKVYKDLENHVDRVKQNNKSLTDSNEKLSRVINERKRLAENLDNIKSPVFKQSIESHSGVDKLKRGPINKGDYTDWWKEALKEQTRYQRMFDQGELKILKAKRSSDDLISKTNEKTLEKIKTTRKSIEGVVSKPYKIKQPTDKIKGGVGIEFGKGLSKDYTKRDMYADLFKQQDDFAKNAAKVRQEVEKNLGKPFQIRQSTDRSREGVGLDPLSQRRIIDKNYEHWWSTELKKRSESEKLVKKEQQLKEKADLSSHKARVKQEANEYKQKVRNAIKLRKELNKQRRARAADQFRRQTLAGVGTERFDYELSSRATKFSQREISGYQKRLSQLNNQLRLNTISSETYRVRLNHLNSDMRKHSTQVRSLSERYGKLRSAIVAGTAAFSGYAGVMSIAQASSAQQQIESMMRAVFFDEAPNQLAFLRKEAMRLGVSFEESAKPFARFAFAAKAAGLSTEEANKQFSGIAELSVIFGNTVDETSGILKALEQMYSKTKVSNSLINW